MTNSANERARAAGASLQVLDLQRRWLLTAIDENLNLPDALGDLVKVADADGGMIEIEKEGQLVCDYAVGMIRSAEGCCSGNSRSLLGHKMDGQVHVIEDPGSAPRHVRSRVRSLGIGAAITIPFRPEGSEVRFLDVVWVARRKLASRLVVELSNLMLTLHTASELMDRLSRKDASRRERIAKLTKEAGREARFVQLLQEVAVAANESATVEQAIHTALGKICRLTGWPVGLFYLADEVGEKLIPTPIWYRDHPIRFNALRRLTQGIEWRKGVGLAGRVFRDGTPAWMTDVRKDPSFVRTYLAASLGVESSFAFPILIGSEVAGVLEFFSRERAEPDERLLEVVAPIGTQLGRVIERKRAQIDLYRSEARYRLLFERNLAGVFRTDPRGKILDANDAMARVLGAESRKDLIGRSFDEFLIGGRQDVRWRRRLMVDKVVTNHEIEVRRLDGERIWTLANLSLIESRFGWVVDGTVLDITERKRSEEEVTFQANHDALTGLLNRPAFVERLDHSIALAKRHRQTLAVLFVDLDDFKPVNDRFGHAVGDWILEKTAERLQEAVRGTDVVGRLGGDEFVVLLNTLKEPEDAGKVATNLAGEIAKPFEHETGPISIRTSIGVSVFPVDGEDVDELLSAADKAMYEAKRSGKSEQT